MVPLFSRYSHYSMYTRLKGTLEIGELKKRSKRVLKKENELREGLDHRLKQMKEIKWMKKVKWGVHINGFRSYTNFVNTFFLNYATFESLLIFL